MRSNTKIVVRDTARDNIANILTGHVQKKKVALRDIAKIEKSQIFVLFENEVSYEDFFCPQVF